MTELAVPIRPRRSQAERRDAMRERLLAAAVALLKEKGLAGFRTAEVADRAAVSKGALAHHFPTKDALVVAVFEQLYGAGAGATHAGPSPTLDKTIDALVLESRAFFFGESFQASLDVTVAAARDPQLRDAVFAVVRRARTRAEALWVQRLSAFGVAPDDALDAVWLINSIVRGLAVRGLWDADSARFRRMERLAADLVVDRLHARRSDAA